MNEDKEKLLQIIKDYPELTFDNDGYQYIDKDILEKHKDVIKLINMILSKYIGGFSKFNNFKPRKDGTLAVRCQYNWNFNSNENSFIGVGYFNIDDIFN